MEVTAPEKAPLLKPNNSLSIKFSGILPQFICTNLPCLLLNLCIVSAIICLPLPLSPVINTVASVLAIFAAVLKIFCMEALTPTSFFVFCGRRTCSLIIVRYDVTLSITSRISLSDDGFTIYSKAPFCMASIAISTVPNAVIKIIGQPALICFISSIACIPPITGIEISISTKSGICSSNTFKACLPSNAVTTSSPS